MPDMPARSVHWSRFAPPTLGSPGMDGVVASPAETAAVRAIVGPDMAVVIPGIRPAGSEAGDQKRIATPAAAIKAGADYLVVGRPITAASDPKSAPTPLPPKSRSPPTRENNVAKGYWVVRVDVSNPDEYAKYAVGNPAIFAKFGGRFIARGGKSAAVEGSGRTRNVLIEFPDYETALACFNSANTRRI